LTVLWDGTPDRPMGKYLAMEDHPVRSAPHLPEITAASQRDRVFDALEHKPMTASELTAYLDVPYASARNRIGELQQANRITIVGRQLVIPPRYGHRSVAN
jgi:hypothetical protein